MDTATPRQPNQFPLTRQHAERRLRPVERALLDRHRDRLQSGVLELVPGGSRLTEELVRTANSYVGISPSSAVIGVCRHLYAGRGSFVHADIRELDQFEPGAFGAVVAWRGGIDDFEDDQRHDLISGVRRVLAADGALIFSSRNLAANITRAELARRAERPRGRLLSGLRSRSPRPTADPQEVGHAVLIGVEGEPGSGHYFIGRDAQQRQLEELGFRFVECRDLRGEVVPPGDDAAGSLELHYVAEPFESAPPVAM